MKILIFSQYFWPENFRVNDVARELIARGHDVTILTSVPNYPDGTVFPAYQDNPRAFDWFHGAPVFRIPQMPRGRTALRLLMNYLSFVVSGFTFGLWKLRDRQFDVIFAFETSPITSILPALLVRRIKSAPLLLWVLDLWPDSLSAVGMVRSEHLLSAVGRVVSFIYQRCDRILVQSRAFFENVRHFSGNDARVRYFPQWAEAGISATSPAIGIPPEMQGHLGGFNIVFAGNIGEAQDFPAILEAAAILQDDKGVRWFIIGDGRAAPRVEDEIAQRGLADTVTLLGRHPLERMPEFLGCADALLVSLRDEPTFAMTIPGKVQSYLASGMPIIGMLNGEGRRVIDESGAGLTCAAGDAIGLVAAIRTLKAMSSAERAVMGQRGKDYCHATFDFDALITRLESWMEQSIDEYLHNPVRRYPIA